MAFFGGVPDGTYTVSETVQGSHLAVGSTYRVSIGGVEPAAGENGAAGSSRSGLTVGLDQTLVVHFFNREKGDIEVIKFVTDQVGNATRGGWQFTVTGGCDGIAIQGVTAANGTLLFNDLKPTTGCAPYIVTETLANQDGFSTSPSAAQEVHVAPGDVSTVTFTNSRGTITTFIPEPTPTNTPEPTATAEPTETVAGEITPGPGDPSPTTDDGGNLATPIAPEAGTGSADGAGGASMLLVLLGLAAITMGSGFLALGRKRA
jgi:hypothetical protein